VKREYVNKPNIGDASADCNRRRRFNISDLFLVEDKYNATHPKCDKLGNTAKFNKN